MKSTVSNVYRFLAVTVCLCILSLFLGVMPWNKVNAAEVNPRVVASMEARFASDSLKNYLADSGVTVKSDDIIRLVENNNTNTLLAESSGGPVLSIEVIQYDDDMKGVTFNMVDTYITDDEGNMAAADAPFRANSSGTGIVPYNSSSETFTNKSITVTASARYDIISIKQEGELHQSAYVPESASIRFTDANSSLDVTLIDYHLETCGALCVASTGDVITEDYTYTLRVYETSPSPNVTYTKYSTLNSNYAVLYTGYYKSGVRFTYTIGMSDGKDWPHDGSFAGG